MDSYDKFFSGYLYVLPTLSIIVGNFFISRHLTRQTGRLRPGLLAALLANILLLVAFIPWRIALALSESYTYVTSYALDPRFFAFAFYYLKMEIIPQVVIALISTGVVGWLGARQGLHSTTKEAEIRAEADHLAKSHGLGDAVKVYHAMTSASTYVLVFGGIGGLLLLFIVQRAVLHITGTSVATDFFEGVIGLVALLIIAIRRRGQHVYVYHGGIVGYGASGQLSAIPWEGCTLRFQDNAFRLVGKSGNSLKVLKNIEAFEELNALVQSKASQASYAVRV